MNRVKFRAWCKVDKMMYYNIQAGIKFDDGSIYTFDRFVTPPATEEDYDYHDWVVMQFTGLHDKNGKEIYEGDIISLIDDVGDEILVICEFGTVQREIYGQTLNLCDITGFYFRKDNRATFPIVNNYAGKHDLELFEVIGNIHQNPELLQ